MDKFQKVAAHAFIVRSDGKFLITHRVTSDDHSPNVYDLPGGSIEIGEEIIDALKREINEETGLVIKVNKPLFVFSFMSGPLRHQFQIVYESEYIKGEVKLNPAEHDSFMWVNFEDLKNLAMIPFLKAFVEDHAKLDRTPSNASI